MSQAPAPWRLYTALVLHHRWIGAVALLLLLGLAATQLPSFRLDASADSLILENDEDLHYLREMGQRYTQQAEFVIVTYTPQGDLFADATLARLQQLRDDLRAVEGVSGVTSILDVPLVASPPMSLTQIQEGTRTLLDPDTDRDLAREEFANSPLYRSLLTDPAGETTALQVTLAGNARAEELLQRREDLRAQRREGALTAEQATELARVEAEYDALSAQRQEKQRALIATLRDTIAPYKDEAKIFLGGVPMIAADMIRFVEQDIRLFGGLVLALLVLLLSLIHI